MILEALKTLEAKLFKNIGNSVANLDII